MDSPDEFTGLIRGVSRGDPAATAELLRRYEPEVRRAVHMRLTDPGLRRVLDTMDICQSVFAAFYVRAAAGAFELEQPHDVVRLLVRMAQNRIHDHYRRHHAQRRGEGRVMAGADEALQAHAAGGPTPSVIIADRDLLQRVLGRLSPEERYLAEQRAAEKTWNELAAELGEGADALRVRLRRAVARASAELGLGDDEDD